MGYRKRREVESGRWKECVKVNVKVNVNEAEQMKVKMKIKKGGRQR